MAISLEDTIKRRLQAVPESPGVYMFRDNKSQVIYVGKALRLRDRLLPLVSLHELLKLGRQWLAPQRAGGWR